MTAPPIAFVVVLVLALVLCRPWLAARRPSIAIGILLGALLSRTSGGWLDPTATRELAVVAGGWLALAAGALWDTSAARRAGMPGRIPWLAIPALVAAGITWLVLPSAPLIAIAVGIAGLALDPSGAQ